MISIVTLVHIMLALLVLALVFGLFMFLINYIAKQWPDVAPFAPIARIALVVLTVLVLIGIILQLAGYPLIAF